MHQGTEQIISLEARTEPDTLVLRDHLQERAVFSAACCAASYAASCSLATSRTLT
jgi:CAI-1 autoinducer synthase